MRHLLLATLGARAASTTAIGHWPALRAAAGPAAPRLFDATERLFGAAQPALIFWRDSAGWCPFCCMTWLLLEEMRVPYRVHTVPLRRYMLDGEQKDPEYIRQVGPNGVVPGVQFWDPEAGAFEDAVQSVEHIFDELAQRYPEAYPRGDAATCAQACDGQASIFGRMRVARRAYEACAGADGIDPLAKGLACALEDLDAMLARSGGPYLAGARPSVADLMLLPFLERTEAVVPYFFGKGALEALPFARAATMLEVARSQQHAFQELCSDATTLGRTNLRYAAAGATPRYGVPLLSVDEAAATAIDGTATATRDEWAATAGADARRDAAARLAATPVRIAAFARRCAEQPPPQAGPDALAEALDDALHATASLLLVDDEERGQGMLSGRVDVAAEALELQHGAEATSDAAAALEALSLNVGVPRDMSTPSARALRSHLRLLAAALRGVASDRPGPRY